MKNDKITQVINGKLPLGVISQDFWPKALSMIHTLVLLPNRFTKMT